MEADATIAQLGRDTCLAVLVNHDHLVLSCLDTITLNNPHPPLAICALVENVEQRALK